MADSVFARRVVPNRDVPWFLPHGAYLAPRVVFNACLILFVRSLTSGGPPHSEKTRYSPPPAPCNFMCLAVRFSFGICNFSAVGAVLIRHARVVSCGVSMFSDIISYTGAPMIHSPGRNESADPAVRPHYRQT